MHVLSSIVFTAFILYVNGHKKEQNCTLYAWRFMLIVLIALIVSQKGPHRKKVIFRPILHTTL